MFSRHIIFSLLFVLQFLMAKANSLDGHCGLHSREGYIEFSYPSIPANLSARTWYRIVGDVENLKYPKRPLVVLHGGPAATSVYLRPTFDLFSERTGRPVIYYDQFGCGNSTHYPEKVGDESFWTVELFEAELRNVLSHLNISEDYDLYGHSWGGMLAAKHAFLSRPKGLHRLVFGGSPARMSDWGEAAQQLLSKLPQDVQDAIRENDANKTYDNPEYQNAVLVYYQNYLYRGDPWPAALNDALAALSSPDSYYITMQGPSELSIAGTLRDFDMSEECKQIYYPTLVMYGDFDEAQRITQIPWLEGLPYVQELFMTNSSHMALLEHPDEYIKIVSEFL